MSLEERINATQEIHEKEWGREIWIANNDRFNYCGKILELKKGYQCSIHMHKVKSEIFYVRKGLVLMKAYNEERLMKKGESLEIEPGTKHRFIGLSDAEIFEFSSFHKEEDSYRDEPSGKVPEEVFEKYLAQHSVYIAENESKF
ncbi:MAG: cupin domain-containing protein [Candidatus Nanoarchaeia archaeon]|nr:cupin domain-containing protein [Candidatus Nanoarchaeia archaeon]